MAETFGRLLRRQREALDLTREELAARVSCSVELIRKIEAGTRRPSKQVAARLADQLEVSPDARSTFLRVARGQANGHTVSATTADVTRASDTYEPGRSTAAAPAAGNFPAPVTSLIGRARELRELDALLRRGDVRLVTLTGPGGSGKTSLALALAWFLPHIPEHGVWFVDLAPAVDIAQVERALIQALGTPMLPDLPAAESLRHWLRERELLLLLDNLEHIIEAASLVADMLRAAPGLRVVTTSRVPLRLRGEWTYAVKPLLLPPDNASLETVQNAPAVQLFVERARALQHDFALDGASAAAVAAICRRLDGLPLAIELVATRLQVFGPNRLLKELEQVGPLQLLTTGPRDAHARQQTIRATLAWSYVLLTAEERALFARLGVFAGSWSAAAAEAVSGEDGELVGEQLATLVAHHLVRRADEADGEPHFRLLALVREYAREQLVVSGGLAAAEAQHAAFYAAFAAAAAEQIEGSERARWHACLARAYDDMLAALRWCLARPTITAEAVALVAGLSHYWMAVGLWTEARAWIDQVLATLPTTGARERAVLLSWKTLFAYRQGERGAPQEAIRAARSAGDERLLAQTLILACGSDIEEGLTLARRLGDRRLVAEAAVELTTDLLMAGEDERAAELLAEADAYQSEVGNEWALASIHYGLGAVAFRRGDYGRAVEHCRAMADLLARTTNHPELELYYDAMGKVALAQGDHATAREMFARWLTFGQEHGNRIRIARALLGLGQEALLRGEVAEAEARFAAAEAEASALVHTWLMCQLVIERGYLSVVRGAHQQAAAFFRTALHRADAPGSLVAYAIEGGAQLAAVRGEGEVGAYLLGCAEAAWTPEGRDIYPADRYYRATIVAAIQALLAPNQFELAHATGRKQSVTAARDAALGAIDVLIGAAQ